MEMQIEQNFTDSDLEDIYQVLLLSNNNNKKVRYMDKLQRENWVRTMKNLYSAFDVCVVILLACIRLEIISMEVKTVMYIIIGGTALYLIGVVYMRIPKELDLREVVQRIGRNPPAVVLRENAVSYREDGFGYASIIHIIEYHDLLCIKYMAQVMLNGTRHEYPKTIFIKVEESQKEAVLSTLYEKSGVCAVKKENIFSLREYSEGR